MSQELLARRFAVRLLYEICSALRASRWGPVLFFLPMPGAGKLRALAWNLGYLQLAFFDSAIQFMKRFYFIVFICLLSTFSVAGDVANSFEQASALALAQRKDSAVQSYSERDLMPYYQQKYMPIFQSCLATTENRDMSSFSFVVAIGSNGRVLQIYTDHETNIFACARQALQRDEFPHPPVSPCYMMITMTFGNAVVDGTPADSSFKRAAAIADAQDSDPATQEYARGDLNPYYRQKYGPIFNSCLASTEHPDKSSFSFIAKIGKDGRVLQLYVDHQTNIFACVRRTLEKDEFPHPPVAPYYMHMSMNFGE